MCKISSYVVAVTVLLALALCPVAARADSTTFDLAVKGVNGTLDPGMTGPYVQVTVDTGLCNSNCTSATISFTGLSQTVGGTAYLYQMGDGESAMVNINSANFTVTGIVDAGDTGINGSGPHGLPYGNAPAPLDTFQGGGTYNFWISNDEGPLGNNPYGGITNSISLTVNDLGGASWNGSGNVLASNGGTFGFEAGAQIFATDSQCLAAQNCKFGYAAGLAPVPEPPVNALLACSALLFGGLFWRRPLWF